MASAPRVQFPAGKEAYWLCRWACYRIKFLNRHRGFTCVLLKCDRWQRLNLESRLTTVCTASGILMLQATWVVSRPLGCGLLGGWPATGSPTGARRACGGRAGLSGSCMAWHKRNKAGLKLGALLNTVQDSLSLHITHTYTHTHTQGCTMAYLYGLGAVAIITRPVSGVEWSGQRLKGHDWHWGPLLPTIGSVKEAWRVLYTIGTLVLWIVVKLLGCRLSDD